MSLVEYIVSTNKASRNFENYYHNTRFCMLRLLYILTLATCCISLLQGQNTAQNPIKAYVFLSDGCPMCQGYAPVLNQLSQDFEAKGVEIIGVFPNYYVQDSAIMAFRKEYFINFKTLIDTNFLLTNRFQASITPQIFIEDQDGALMYSGQIDNAYFRAGKRRGVTTENYARNAIEALLKKEKPQVTATQAVGCVIVRE